MEDIVLYLYNIILINKYMILDFIRIISKIFFKKIKEMPKFNTWWCIKHYSYDRQTLKGFLITCKADIWVNLKTNEKYDIKLR